MEASDEMKRKQESIQDRLEKSKQQLQDKIAKQREEDSEMKTEDEDYKNIDIKFNKDFDAIQDAVLCWRDLSGVGEASPLSEAQKKTVQAFFEEQFSKFKELREYVNTYTFAIPSYLFSQYNQRLEKLNEVYNKAKDEALPKKKFSFMGKGKNVAKKKKEEVAQAELAKKEEILDQGNHMRLKDMKGQEVVAAEKEYEGKENLIIEDIEACSVRIPFAVKCLYIKNVKNSKLYFSGVENASFINSVTEGSVLYLASHQIRIHNTYDTVFHLQARSNPIIEHCSGLKFGDLSKTDEGQSEENLAVQKKAGLFDIKNMFDQVHDFNWLKQEHSPNWASVE